MVVSISSIESTVLTTNLAVRSLDKLRTLIRLHGVEVDTSQPLLRLSNRGIYG